MPKTYQQSIAEIVQTLERLKTADMDPFASAVKTAYQEEVYVVDAIDTGRFIQSIDYYQTGASGPDNVSYNVDSSKDPLVTYDGFVEAGTIYMNARWPAKRALENLSLLSAADALVQDAFYPVFT